MGVVKKFSDYQRPQVEAVEQRVADLDDGFTRLATMLLEEYAGADLTKRQFKVLLAVLRMTYGWNKPHDRIANSQIAEIAKLPIKRVSETRVQLVEMNILKKTGSHIGPNKNISEWTIPQSEGLSPKLRDKKSPKLGDSNPSKQGDTIDIIPKTLKTTTPNPLPGVDSLPAKPARRKSAAIKYDEYLNAYNAVVADRLPHAVDANQKRKQRLRELIPKLATPNVDGFRAYVRAFVGMAKPFYFGDNDRGWTADFDFMLRDTTLTGVREGKFANRREF